jgi:FAD/FMN-containing dehydrogenase
MSLAKDVALATSCEVTDDESTLTRYSRDTSIFTRTPKLVAYPKSSQEASRLVEYVHGARSRGADISITGRSAGTDMTGGVLSDSIVAVFTKYMNHLFDTGRDPHDTANSGFAVAEPGMYYRDFEKITREKLGMIYPAYPASRELCAIGGIVSNNSGGELNLRYGKTEKHVRQLEVALSDGSLTTVRPLTMNELARKELDHSLEGSIYTKIHALIKEHREEIERARPSVTKNSAGYNLWDVLDEKKGTFDLTKLIVGSQGTLALVTKAKLGLVKPKKHRSMLVVFMADLGILPEVVKRVLANNPESFESYDDKTFGLAVRFAPQMLMQMGLWDALKLGFAFIPDIWAVLWGGVPKLVLLAEFAEDASETALLKAQKTERELSDLHLTTRIARTEAAAAKYWKVRRESFALLRKNVRGRYAAPFIDDIVVHPSDYPKFLPELDALVSHHRFIYTIAGHIGDGNFHIIPLVNMSGKEDRSEILELMPKVYALVQKYHGSITGEHNDGILRTPYLPLMFSPTMIELFKEVKNIFDPLGVFNPGKKVGGTLHDIERSIITHV